MKRAIIVVFGVVIGAVILFAALKMGAPAYYKWQSSVRKERAASEVESLLHPDTRMILFSLNPDRSKGGATNTGPVFHEFLVLGEVEVKEPGDRAKILSEFASDVRNGPTTVAACFNPRHGLRLINQSVVTDFSICFECRGVRVYRNSESQPGFSTGSRSASEFNSFLDKHGIPRVTRKR